MAHFAQISDRNVVLQVLVIADTDCLDESGVESESVGIDYCKSLFGADTRWVQTSYTSRIRGVYASAGFIYDPVADIFYDPFCNPPEYLTE